jgi:hypothetical protein
MTVKNLNGKANKGPKARRNRVKQWISIENDNKNGNGSIIIVGPLVKFRSSQLSGSCICIEKITFNNSLSEKNYKILMLTIHVVDLTL